MWATVVIASLATYCLKIFGYFLPESLVTQKTAKNVIAVLPIGLLAGLIAIQLFTTQSVYAIDGRIAGTFLAVVLLVFRAPFILVISVSALVTALGRSFGLWG